MWTCGDIDSLNKGIYMKNRFVSTKLKSSCFCRQLAIFVLPHFVITLKYKKLNLKRKRKNSSTRSKSKLEELKEKNYTSRNW